MATIAVPAATVGTEAPAITDVDGLPNVALRHDYACRLSKVFRSTTSDLCLLIKISCEGACLT